MLVFNEGSTACCWTIKLEFCLKGIQGSGNDYRITPSDSPIRRDDLTLIKLVRSTYSLPLLKLPREGNANHACM